MAIGLLGTILVRKGFITQGQLDEVLKKSPENEDVLGRALVKMGYLTEEKLFFALSEQFNLPFYPSLRDLTIDREVIKAVSVKCIQHYGFMPVKLEGAVLTVAVCNTMDVWLAEDIKLSLGYQISRVLSTKSEIDEAIHKYYGATAGTVDRILSGKKGAKDEYLAKDETVEDIEKSAEEASVIKLVNQILTEAIQMGATDIHIELYPGRLALRYRIDGVLRDIKVPEEVYYLEPAIISRIKIMCHLDVVEHRVPQDGRAKVRLQNGQEVDLRISIIQAYFGENVVIRILPSQVMLDFDRIGFDPGDLEKIEKIIQKPHGIILITGPTGSGKTTTLYTCLSKLNKPEVKIISIEDPVEYAIEGIAQIQVNVKVGLTFASILRSVLRHDPDVMMVGEIRDLETADLAIRASLTGHLVFSTLHTNDAASAISRLIDMGIEPFLLASSIGVIIAQRLIRLYCPNCKGKGCDNCNRTGYKGRRAIFEILLIEDEMRALIMARKNAADIKKRARELGMRTLRERGLQLAQSGLTAQEEVTRVVEAEE